MLKFIQVKWDIFIKLTVKTKMSKLANIMQMINFDQIIFPEYQLVLQQMNEIQTSLDHNNFLSLAHPRDLQCFQDEKTRQLYSVLTNVQDSRKQPTQMEAFRKLSRLRSHSQIATHSHFQKIKEEAFALKGVTLRQNSNHTHFNRNRTFSIIKASKQVKKTITSQQFNKISNAIQIQTQQIVYQYDPKCLQMKTLPFLTQTSSLKNIGSFHLNSRSDLKSAAPTTQRKSIIIPGQSRQFSNKVKPYKFLKLKTYSKPISTSIQPHNIFNFLDKYCNNQGYSKGKSQKIQLASKPIKQRK